MNKELWVLELNKMVDYSTSGCLKGSRDQTKG